MYSLCISQRTLLWGILTAYRRGDLSKAMEDFFLRQEKKQWRRREPLTQRENLCSETAASASLTLAVAYKNVDVKVACCCRCSFRFWAQCSTSPAARTENRSNRDVLGCSRDTASKNTAVSFSRKNKRDWIRRKRPSDARDRGSIRPIS
jgi:hypothetical protein